MSNSIELELMQHIREQILGGDSSIQFDESTPLAQSGVLDSMAFMEFVQHVEQNYQLQFAPEDFSSETLGCVKSCASYIESKKALA